jgi:hypothetical protein
VLGNDNKNQTCVVCLYFYFFFCDHQATFGHTARACHHGNGGSYTRSRWVFTVMALLQYRTRSHLGCAEGKRMLGTCTMGLGVDDMCTPFANWHITRVMLSTYVSAIHVDKSGRDLKPPVRSLRLRFQDQLAQESHTSHRNAKGNLLQ